MFILLDICAPFKEFSVDCKCCFGPVNLIKSTFMNRLDAGHLDNLMCIKSHFLPGQNIESDINKGQQVKTGVKSFQ
jgi:hypothetical protein